MPANMLIVAISLCERVPPAIAPTPVSSFPFVFWAFLGGLGGESIRGRRARRPVGPNPTH